MVLARVVGNVVSNHKNPSIEGIKLLLLEHIDVKTLSGKKSFVVAMDSIGVGNGEIVFYVTGSSSRLTSVTKNKPCDATIIANVDIVELEGEVVYKKDKKS